MMPGQGWGNPVVGGVALRRPAIQSPNFVHNSTGWTVNQDGSAEFQNVIIRGTITAGSFTGSDFVLNNNGFFVYSGAPALGNLIVSIAPVSGTDSFGNAYPQGINVTMGTISGTTITGATISGGTVSGTTITGTTFDGTDFIINSSGAFFYSTTPANGKLIASIASANGTDGFSNGFLAGISNYVNNSGVITTTNILSGTLWFYQGTVANPGTTQLGWVGTSGTGGLEILSGTGTTPLILSAPVQVSGNVVNLTDVLSSSPGAPALGGSLWANSNGTVSAVNSVGQQGQLPMTQTDVATITNTANTSFAALSKVWGVAANDGSAGTAYRLTVAGSGTWGSTQEQLFFLISGMGTTMGQIIIGSSVFPISTAFAWKVVCEIVLASTTVARCTINGVLSVNNGNAVVVANGAANTTIPFTSWQSPVTVVTSSATNLTLQSKWGGAFGSIASAYSIFERIGP